VAGDAGNGCIPSELRTSGRNPAAAAGRPYEVAADLQRRGMEVGGWRQHSCSRNRPGDLRNSRDLRVRSAARRGFSQWRC
jgi:hypothetical protein